MRLQKYISQSGYCSRRKAEELIKAGRVRVNNNIITEMGVVVNDDDIVFVDDERITQVEKKVYYLLNKPRGLYVVQTMKKGEKLLLI